MGGMWIPTMAGLARLSLIRVIADRPNVAGTATNVEYTVPAGRMAIITTLAIEHRGGLAYANIGFDFHIAGAGTAGSIIQAAPPGIQLPIAFTGWLWLQETDTIDSVVTGGDATSDHRVIVLGAEFDWAASDDLD